MSDHLVVDQHPNFAPPTVDVNAVVLAESRRRFGTGMTRFLVSVFAADAPGLLRAATEVLADGVQGASGRRVRFNIEASLGVSIAELWALTLVVHPGVDDEGEIQEDTTVDAGVEVRELLQQRLKDVLSQGTSPEVTVEPLDSSNSTALFADRVLREYRFAAGPAAAETWVSDILRVVAAALGDRTIPVCYFHFPHRWAPPAVGEIHADPDHWLRIAFAPEPDRLGEQADLDLLVMMQAADRDIAMAVYDPLSPSAEMSNKFVLASAVDPRVDDPPSPSGRVLGILVEGEAKVGLVSAVLDAVPDGLLEASMTVLYGRSVVMLAVKEDVGAQAMDALTGKGASCGFRPVSKPATLVPRLASRPTTSFWVAWVCNEDHGVIHRILDVVTASVSAATEHEPNIVYAITRVLADGYSCAGKVKFTLPEACEALNEDVMSQVTAQLKVALGGLLEDRAPDEDAEFEVQRMRSLKRRVEVQHREPTVEPWATLAAFGASLDLY